MDLLLLYNVIVWICIELYWIVWQKKIFVEGGESWNGDYIRGTVEKNYEYLHRVANINWFWLADMSETNTVILSSADKSVLSGTFRNFQSR